MILRDRTSFSQAESGRLKSLPLSARILSSQLVISSKIGKYVAFDMYVYLLEIVF